MCVLPPLCYLLLLWLMSLRFAECVCECGDETRFDAADVRRPPVVPVVRKGRQRVRKKRKSRDETRRTSSNSGRDPKRLPIQRSTPSLSSTTLFKPPTPGAHAWIALRFWFNCGSPPSAPPVPFPGPVPLAFRGGGAPPRPADSNRLRSSRHDGHACARSR